MSSTSKNATSGVACVLDGIDRWSFRLGCVYFAIFAFCPGAFTESSHSEDPMTLSGFGVLLVGVYGARRLQRGFTGRITSLTRTGVLLRSGTTDFECDFHRVRAIAIPVIAGSLIPLTIGGIWAANSTEVGKLYLVVGALLGIWLVSARFGWAVATGVFALRLDRLGISITVTPGASDRAAGLRMLGDFYFFQALFVLVPALFMSFWMIAVEAEWAIASGYWHCELPRFDCDPHQRVGTWTSQFLALIAFDILVIFNPSVLLPGWLIGRKMKAATRTHVEPVVRRLEGEICDLRSQVFPSDREDQEADHSRLGLFEEITRRATQLDRYRSTPTWPMPLGRVLTTVLANASALVGLSQLISRG